MADNLNDDEPEFKTAATIMRERGYIDDDMEIVEDPGAGETQEPTEVENSILSISMMVLLLAVTCGCWIMRYYFFS